MRFRIDRLEQNRKGRDLLVGDIHGCADKLLRQLARINFDAKRDRLFILGDLIDRGPQPLQVLALLDEPWCFAISGNHEDALLSFEAGLLDAEQILSIGANWFLALSQHQQYAVLERLKRLPVAIELQTATGPLGLVHAECPTDSWSQFVEALRNRDEHARVQAMWSRKRIKSGRTSWVYDLRAVVAGHTPVPEMQWLGNTLYIDTGAWANPDSDRTSFCMLDAATLEPAGTISPKRSRSPSRRFSVSGLTNQSGA